MRLLLDHQLSPRRVGRLLRTRGHDLLALADEIEFAGLADVDVLSLAAEEGRILVTCNARDFAPLAREWSEASQPHAGIGLAWTFANNEYGGIVRALDRLFKLYPRQREWRDLVLTI